MKNTITEIRARLWRASIWHPDAIPHNAAYIYVSPIKRVFLPLFDVIIVWLGLAGLIQGFQAVTAIVPSVGPTVLYGMLALSGLLCFVCAGFPRLWRAEIGGKVVILVILTMVAASMLIAGLTLPGHTGVTIMPLVVGLMIPPLIRLWTIGSEAGDRSAR